MEQPCAGAVAAGEFELRENIVTERAAEEAAEVNGQALKPADGGRAAWTMLIAAWVFEGVVWGFPLSFGVFQNYYSQLPQFANNSFIAIIGTVATGVSYLGGPFAMPLVNRYLKYRKHMIWTGWIICMTGLAAGSFATSIGTLVVTQGVMFGFGFLLVINPIISIMNEWWIQRRGMAFGIICSATGFTGVAMPFIVEALLKKYGYQTTLRAMAVGLALITAPLMPFLKSRLPPSEHVRLSKTDWTFFKNPLFYVLNLSNLMQAFGYFFPTLYLPSHAAAIGLPPTQGALLVALMAITQVLGQMTFGYLTDKNISISLLVMLSTVVSAASTLLLWGFADSLALLVAYALVYGFFGAGFVALWARMGMEITDEPSGALAMFGIFSFGKGIGNVLAGPIAAGLLKPIMVSEYGILRYRGVIFFSASMMLASAASVGLWSAQGKVRRLL